ncbi:MAG: GGDEF domain-containing protein [Pseudomonadota bacterium]
MQLVTVGELMNPDPTTLPPDAPLSAVTGIMSAKRFSCMIIAENEMPIGIVTERDLVKHLNHLLLSGVNVEDVNASHVMSSPPLTVEDDASMFEALVLMQGRHIRHLPVVRNGLLTGILTYSDLARAHKKIIETQSEAIDQAVALRTSELEETNEQLKALSMEDSMLGIGNRRAMEVDLAYTHQSSIRYKRPYSVVLYDVDAFKLYNDHYGHQAGDEALQQVAEHLRDTVRGADRLYRYGGEEILLLLPETDLSGAEILASRTIEDLAARKIPHEKSSYEVLTMSGGIGSPDFTEDPKDWNAVVKQADLGLYDAKSAGRNRVVCRTSEAA